MRMSLLNLNLHTRTACWRVDACIMVETFFATLKQQLFYDVILAILYDFAATFNNVTVPTVLRSCCDIAVWLLSNIVVVNCSCCFCNIAAVNFLWCHAGDLFMALLVTFLWGHGLCAMSMRHFFSLRWWLFSDIMAAFFFTTSLQHLNMVV